MPQPPAQPSVVDSVVERLVAAILEGTYPAGSRLPAERELSAELGVARVSLRAALRRLIEWGLVTTRQGSGALVQTRRLWTANALAPALHHAMQRGNLEGLLPLIRDGLELRRSLVLDLVRRSAGRVKKGGLASARARVREAWGARGDMIAFLRIDRHILLHVLEAAEMWPSLWLMNTLGPSYLAAIGGLAATMKAPPTFESAHLAMLDAVEAGDAQRAHDVFSRYLDSLDLALVETLPPELAALIVPRRSSAPPTPSTPPPARKTAPKKPLG